MTRFKGGFTEQHMEAIRNVEIDTKVVITQTVITARQVDKIKLAFLFFFFFFFVGSGAHPQPMEVPSLGVQSELQLLAYTTATATPDPSHVCALHHSSKQYRIL